MATRKRAGAEAAYQAIYNWASPNLQGVHLPGTGTKTANEVAADMRAALDARYIAGYADAISDSIKVLREGRETPNPLDVLRSLLKTKRASQSSRSGRTKPLNGEKTHPLKPAAIAVLISLAEEGPLASHRINPGVRDRLRRENLAEEFMSEQGKNCYRITDAGKRALSAIKGGVN